MTIKMYLREGGIISKLVEYQKFMKNKNKAEISNLLVVFIHKIYYKNGFVPSKYWWPHEWIWGPVRKFNYGLLNCHEFSSIFFFCLWNRCFDNGFVPFKVLVILWMKWRMSNKIQPWEKSLISDLDNLYIQYICHRAAFNSSSLIMLQQGNVYIKKSRQMI